MKYLALIGVVTGLINFNAMADTANLQSPLVNKVPHGHVFNKTTLQQIDSALTHKDTKDLSDDDVKALLCTAIESSPSTLGCDDAIPELLRWHQNNKEDNLPWLDEYLNRINNSKKY
ncbi:hypothetical protein KWH75_06920 [Morganella morganii]|uniref:hypothetical protein n=1 Tax=Morganella morganii TaxID=582 RepID=UPI0021CF15D2|nr:hypothetical protein [Morganella morganii]MCU6236800.1 hypothetical protein [Morganella morganii]